MLLTENHETADTLADDILFGASAIAIEIGLDVRKTFYLLERGHIPATKVGRMWTTTRSRLRRFFAGEMDVDATVAVVAPEPAPAPKRSKRRHRAKAAA